MHSFMLKLIVLTLAGCLCACNPYSKDPETIGCEAYCDRAVECDSLCGLDDFESCYDTCKADMSACIKDHGDDEKTMALAAMNCAERETCTSFNICINGSDISGGIWTDADTSLSWQVDAVYGDMTWSEADDYCDQLGLDGYTDWRLPTIDELRGVIYDCPTTETGGLCDVTDRCLELQCWHSSSCGTRYSSSCAWTEHLFSNCDCWSWSASEVSDQEDQVWTLDFSDGSLDATGTGASGGDTPCLRCVR